MGCLLAAPASAHEEIEAQVAALTLRLASDPGNSALLSRRGELHRMHGEWRAALADFRRAHELDPDLHIVHLCLGRTLLEAGFSELSLVAFDRFVALRPENAEGRLARGRALLGLGLYQPAAAEMARGVELQRRIGGDARPPRPEDYIDAARALAAAGSEHLEDALRRLDEGSAVCGRAVVFDLLAIDLELSRGHHDAALARVAALASRSPRKESWLARRGEVLALAGRPAEARQAYEECLEAVAGLPPHCRETRAVADLVTRARRALSALSPPGGASSPVALGAR